jgi:nucleotide-binding universal stress UspA family protein
MFTHILIPTDGSEIALRAVKAGVALARSFGARVTILCVAETLATVGEGGHAFEHEPETWRAQALAYLQGDARSAVAAAVAEARAAGVTVDSRIPEATHPDQAIIDAAKALPADLIVMGSHGRRGVSALLLGSVAQKVLTHCDVPVLVVR